MSQFLNFAGNQGTTFKNHGTGGGTSFTLDVNATTNSVLLAIGGVLQEPGVDYTVSGTTVTTTTSVTAGIEVFSWVIHKPGTAPVIQDNSVDGAKIALTSQAEGDIMYCDASGNWVRLAKGTAGQVLKQNSGLTAPEWGTDSSGSQVFLSTSVASATANVDLTFTPTDYDAFRVVMTGLRPATDDAQMLMYVSTDGGSTFLTATNYRWAVDSFRSDNNVNSNQAEGTGEAKLTLNNGASVGLGNASAERGMLDLYINDPGDATAYTTFKWTGCYHNAATSTIHTIHGAASYLVAQDTDAVRFQFHSGNIAEGRFTLYGLKYS